MAPAVLPPAQANMPAVNYLNVQPSSVGNSLSTQSNDSCSDMSDEHLHALPDDKVTPPAAHPVLRSVCNVCSL